MSAGELGILNVGAGDIKVSFDPANPEECERAAAVVMDMLKRGYAIMVQVGERDGKPIYMRADSFDPATCEYLVMGLPEPVPTDEEMHSPARGPIGMGETQAAKETKRRRWKRIAARKTHGVGVAPISGG